MAAKSAAKKTAKSVKTSKTTKSRSGFTAAQRSAYNAALKAALKSSVRQQRSNAAQGKRARAAAKRAAKRNTFVARRSAKIVRNTYLQAKYGIQTGPVSGVPLRSQLRTQASIAAYLEAHYGVKTFRLTTGTSSVRVKPRVRKGRVVSAGKTAVSKPRTSRSAIAQATQAARSVPKSAKLPSKPRKAAGGRHGILAHAQWITAGNDEGEENCVSVAIANHLLYHTGYRAGDAQVDYLHVLCRNQVDIALHRLDYYEAWSPVSLSEYGPVKPEDAEPGMIVGFATEQGDHCGVLLPGNMVISWGEIVPLESEIEEAWYVAWMTD